MIKSISDYLTAYTTSIYSWRECNSYIFNYYQTKCDVTKLTFKGCNTDNSNPVGHNWNNWGNSQYMQMWGPPTGLPRAGCPNYACSNNCDCTNNGGSCPPTPDKCCQDCFP